MWEEWATQSKGRGLVAWYDGAGLKKKAPERAKVQKLGKQGSKAVTENAVAVKVRKNKKARPKGVKGGETPDRARDGHKAGPTV